MGNTRFLTDSTGGSIKSYNYDPFGNIRNNTGTGNTSYQFQTQQLDNESGLYHLRARQYDPTTGRFISQDPVEGYLNTPQTQNGYSYVGNNPINISDPSGLDYTNIGFNGGGVIGLTAGLLVNMEDKNDRDTHPYLGVGLQTPGIGWNVTYSKSDPNLGWSIGGQAALGGAVGVSKDLGTGQTSWEYGAGRPGLFGGVVYTFNCLR